MPSSTFAPHDVQAVLAHTRSGDGGIGGYFSRSVAVAAELAKEYCCTFAGATKKDKSSKAKFKAASIARLRSSLVPGLKDLDDKQLPRRLAIHDVYLLVKGPCWNVVRCHVEKQRGDAGCCSNNEVMRMIANNDYVDEIVSGIAQLLSRTSNPTLKDVCLAILMKRVLGTRSGLDTPSDIGFFVDFATRIALNDAPSFPGLNAPICVLDDHPDEIPRVTLILPSPDASESESPRGNDGDDMFLPVSDADAIQQKKMQEVDILRRLLQAREECESLTLQLQSVRYQYGLLQAGVPAQTVQQVAAEVDEEMHRHKQQQLPLPTQHGEEDDAELCRLIDEALNDMF